MTELLIRLFVRDRDDVRDPAVYARYGKLAGGVGVCCNLLLALGKLLAGLASGSIAIMGDAVNNLSDASASVITLVGFRLSAKPADKEHPFGHARFEYLAGLGVAVLVLVIGVELGKGSIEKIISPQPVDFGWVSLAVLAASILVKLWMAVFNRHIGRLIGSGTLQATFLDSRNDVIATSAVLVAAVIARLTGLNLDGWMGAGVAVFILASGFGLVKETLDPLLGAAPDPELVQQVADKISAYPGVLGTHDLLVHDYGPGRRFASAHVEMASEVDPIKSHDVIDRIERDFLKQENIHLILHYDPVPTRGADSKARNWVERQVQDIDDRLSIHDFRMVDSPGHLHYYFDISAPPDFEMDDAALAEQVRQALGQGRQQVKVSLTVDRSYAAIPGGSPVLAAGGGAAPGAAPHNSEE